MLCFVVVDVADMLYAVGVLCFVVPLHVVVVVLVGNIGVHLVAIARVDA